MANSSLNLHPMFSTFRPAWPLHFLYAPAQGEHSLIGGLEDITII